MKSHIKFTSDELDFIENQLGCDAWMFNDEADDDEDYDQKDIDRNLTEIAKDVLPVRALACSVAEKVEQYVPKGNAEIMKALKTVVTKHKLTPPELALETLSIEIAQKFELWKA